MTEEQRQYYLDRGDEMHIRNSHHSAGVRLAFWTNSCSLTLSAELWPDLSGIGSGFDVCEDGVLIAHLGGESKEVKGLCTALSKGEHLVEIYFPWSKGVTLQELCLDDGATFVPHHRKYRLLSFGDSITHGALATHPSLTYTERLASLLDADLDNRGIGGDHFSAGLAELEPVENPDIVTVAYGTNDWSHWGACFDEECPCMIKNLATRYPDAEIFVISPIWRGDWDRKGSMDRRLPDLHQTICEYASSYPNVKVINAWNFVPHLSDFFGDGHLHPNDLGFGLYAECLYREIVKYSKLFHA
jgi:lysophospholipase L1-like esterase